MQQEKGILVEVVSELLPKVTQGGGRPHGFISKDRGASMGDGSKTGEHFFYGLLVVN